MKLTLNDFYEVIRELLDETIEIRRESILASRNPAYGPYARVRDRFVEAAHGRTIDQEIEEFINECPFTNERISNFLLSEPKLYDSIELSDVEHEDFLENVEDWESTNNWIAG